MLIFIIKKYYIFAMIKNEIDKSYSNKYGIEV